MRLLPLLAAALLAGCAGPAVTRATHVVPRPAPYEPDVPLGAFGPVIPPAVTKPYPSVLPPT